MVNSENACSTVSLYWRYTVGTTLVQFEGVPFSVGEKRIMDCQHGELYYKPRKSTTKHPRSCLQSTRKIGCTAQITNCQYTLYPEYSVLGFFESKQKEQLAK